MKGSSHQDGRNYDVANPMVIGIVFIFFYVFCIFLWNFDITHNAIVSAYVFVRTFEGMCFLGDLAACDKPTARVLWSDLTDSSMYINLFFLAITIALCLWMYFKVTRTHPKMLFSKIHTVQSFAKEQSVAYPHLNYFLGLDLLNEPINEGDFAMSETSRQFAYKNKLIATWTKRSKDMSSGNIEYTVSVDAEKTKLLFIGQCGEPFTSLSTMNIMEPTKVAELILLAIAMPRVAASNASEEDAFYQEALLDSQSLINGCWAHFEHHRKNNKNGRAWVKAPLGNRVAIEIFNKYYGSENVQKVFYRHSYIRTLIIQMWTEARLVGVLPPAEIRWLRFYNRPLWYLIQGIGRQSAFVESVGAFSHYNSERVAGMGLSVPEVDSAVTALNHALNGFKFTEEEKNDYERQS